MDAHETEGKNKRNEIFQSSFKSRGSLDGFLCLINKCAI